MSGKSKFPEEVKSAVELQAMAKTVVEAATAAQVELGKLTGALVGVELIDGIEIGMLYKRYYDLNQELKERLHCLALYPE